MISAAIYARFSSDLQNDRSTADQIALCCDYAARSGYSIARVYQDAAISGASMHGRLELHRLIADAERGVFKALLVESMSRLGRDQEDRAFIRKRLKFFDVEIATPAEGTVSPIVDGVRAVLDSEMLEDLKRHTRRGMRARVTAGCSAGGLTYGYVPGAQKGERIIVEHEAAIVRRIFAEYLAGRSPRAIAASLNAEHVKAPRGRDWMASSINGNPSRGSGILGNALYDGRLVWNRVSMRKDPRTGKRVSRPNPESEWIIRAVPELRIIDAEIFTAAQAVKNERGHERPERARRPRHLLSGLLRCGCCGGGMVVNNAGEARRIYCGRRKEGGICPNGRTFALAPIEMRVVEGLKRQLAEPAAIARYVETYRAERRRLARAETGKREAAERALAQATREIDRLVTAIAQGALSAEEAGSKLSEPRARKRQLEEEIAAMPDRAAPIELHPRAVETYLKQVDDLAAVLSRRVIEGNEDIAQCLRHLVQSVTISADEDEPKITVTGFLAALTGVALPPNGDMPLITAVAGEGLEPPTSGL